jgi:hypothetical protein
MTMIALAGAMNASITRVRHVPSWHVTEPPSPRVVVDPPPSWDQMTKDEKRAWAAQVVEAVRQRGHSGPSADP